MGSKFTQILTLLLAFVVQFSFAQEKTITGNVTDQQGMPLPGVNIVVKGTNTGTQTDFDGNYSITAGEGQVLVFTYLGMATSEQTVGASSTIDLQMTEDTQALEEVVVVGYGTTTKQAYTGTATVIEAEDVAVKNYSNISQSLAGEASGVTVINTSGQPGTSSTIRIRGFGSVNGNRNPLYVVDGVPFNGSLNSINPADIKSTTILKDATATAIYGSRGANGVILITTKSGSATDSYIEVDLKTGFNTQLIPRYNMVKSPEEYIGYVWEGIYNRGVITGEDNPVSYANDNLFTVNYVHPGYNMWNVADGGELIDPDTRMVRPGVTRRYTPQRYEDLAFDTALRVEANVRMGGGNDKTKYFFSAGYLKDEGYALNTQYDRYTSRLNLTSDVKDWLTLGANIGYTYSESLNNGQTVGSENLFEFADKMAPIFPVFLRDDNYQLVEDPIYGGHQYDYGEASGFRARPNANNLNPIASAKYDHVGNDRHEVNGNVNLKLNIAEGLTFETTYGIQYYHNLYNDAANAFYGIGKGPGGTLYQTKTQVTVTNFLKLLRYKKSFGDHNFEVLAAHESNDYDRNITISNRGKQVLENTYQLSNYIETLSPTTGYNRGKTLESYFGQVNYDFANKYYLSASVRRDGSSRFVNNKWGTFGSVGAAWVLSNEEFLSNHDLFRYLKVKASYGVIGDEGIDFIDGDGEDYYKGADLYDIIFGSSYSFPLNTAENPDLTWETAKMYQGGLEFTLGNFLDGSVDYYVKNTDNLLFDQRQALSTGISVLTVNDGQLRNQGLEFDVTAHLINREDIKLDFAINGASYQNKITKMPIDPTTEEQQELTRSSYYGWSKGNSIYDFYMREWAGVDPSDGAPLWYQYFNDVNGNGVFDDGDEAISSMVTYMNNNPDANVQKQETKTYADATDKYVGKSVIPDIAGGFRLMGQIKDFNFSTQFIYQLGGYGYDYQYSEHMSDRFGAVGNNYHKDIANRWQQPGDVTDVPRLADGLDQRAASTSTRFLTKTDYLGLNNALIGYTLPQKHLEKTGLDVVNIFVSGDNLFLKTARKGFNPNTRQSGQSVRRLYAPMTSFTLGVKLKF